MPANKKQKSTKESTASTTVEIADPEHVELDYINLTTHPDGSAPIGMNWGAPDPMVRWFLVAFKWTMLRFALFFNF